MIDVRFKIPCQHIPGFERIGSKVRISAQACKAGYTAISGLYGGISFVVTAFLCSFGHAVAEEMGLMVTSPSRQ
jgi:hypothetical protein